MIKVRRETYLMGSSGVALLIGFICELCFEYGLSSLFYGIAAVLGLIFVAPAAYRGLKHKRANINLLMGVAVLGALGMALYSSQHGTFDIDTFRDAAIVIFLYQIGEHLEDWSLDKTKTSIDNLMDLAPQCAHLLLESAATDSANTNPATAASALASSTQTGTSTTDYANTDPAHTTTVPLDSVAVGNLLQVLPGERIPVDGVVVKGFSDCNEAPVTGESKLQAKGPHDRVWGGALNVGGTLVIEACATANSGMLARVVSSVEEAQKNQAPYQAFVDRFAAVYTPFIMACAAIVGLVIPAIINASALLFHFEPVSWMSWMARALTLLVIACPCALVISTPVSFVSAITRAARAGILVKGGSFFDIGTHIDTIAFDKTGTLTTGEPTVDAIFVDGITVQQALCYAAALEKNSTHPLAKAVVRYAQEQSVHPCVAEAVQEAAALGISGYIDDQQVFLGKPTAASIQNFSPVLANAYAKALKRGSSVLLLILAEKPCALFSATDTLRPAVRATVEALTHMGYTPLLLSGDNEASARSIAHQAGIERLYFSLLPQDKLEIIANYKSKGAHVAMVGDGINDAPSLAEANLGITMGSTASDTALSVADVALLSGDIEQLPFFFKLSKKTMRIATENIAGALIVKFAILVLAIAGVAGMGAAIFADTGVMLLVVLNGMRLML